MKTILLFFALLFTSAWLYAQTPSEGFPVSVAYYGHFGIHPGVKIGTQFNPVAKSNNLFVSPQIGFFTRPGNHTSFLLNAELGYKKLKEKKERYSHSAWSIGLGYLTQFQVISRVVNLGDGSTRDVKRERRDYFMPTVNYEFGREINPQLSWFSKFSLGAKMSSKRENTTVFFVEAGIQFHLNSKGK